MTISRNRAHRDTPRPRTLEGNETIALPIGSRLPKPQPRRQGSASGKLTVLAEDDEHLKDFGEYIP